MSFRHRALQLLLPLLLPLLLVFSQQQAVLHLLGHDLSQLSVAEAAGNTVWAAVAGPAPTKDPADPQELVCAKCLAVAHFAHVVVGDVPRVEAIRATPERIVGATRAARDLPFFSRYRSRAPPTFS